MARRRKKQSKFGAYVIMIFMVFLLVGSLLSVILFAPPPPSEDITYGDFTFTADQNTGLYTTEIDDKTYRFNNLPFVALTVSVSSEAITLLRMAPALVMTFDPLQTQEDLQYIDFVRFELSSAFPNIGGGVTQASETYALPVVDCANATALMPVLLIDLGEPEIRSEGSCIYLSGNKTTLILAKDALLYNYLGVIESEMNSASPAKNPV